jgi:hypothetical protein
MKKILLAGFAGLCVFGFLIVNANSSGVPYSPGRSFTDALLGDTTAPKKDTAKKEFSKLTPGNHALVDTTAPKKDTAKKEEFAFGNLTSADTTAPKKDTAKLVAYAR